MAADPAVLDRLCADLARIAPGHLPQTLFDAVTRIVVTPTFIVVPLFRRDGATRVCLTRRGADDPYYPGLLHPPGTVILATDTGLEGVFARLRATEIPMLTPLSPPGLAEVFFDQIVRGREIALVHALGIADPGQTMTSHDCDRLPPDVIGTDVPRIAAARQIFETAPATRA